MEAATDPTGEWDSDLQLFSGDVIPDGSSIDATERVYSVLPPEGTLPECDA